MNKHILTLIMILFLGESAAWAGDLEDGNAAMKRKDYATALAKFLDSAKKGNVDAQLNLGIMYEKGIGVKRNDVEAVRWYKLSAEHGDAVAQFNLGVMYEKGFGVAQNYEQAIRL